MSLDRRLGLAENQPEPNGALREIAGRIGNLSYRDMLAFAKVFGGEMATAIPLPAPVIATALLAAADKLRAA